MTVAVNMNVVSASIAVYCSQARIIDGVSCYNEKGHQARLFDGKSDGRNISSDLLLRFTIRSREPARKIVAAKHVEPFGIHGYRAPEADSGCASDVGSPASAVPAHCAVRFQVLSVLFPEPGSVVAREPIMTWPSLLIDAPCERNGISNTSQFVM